MATQDPWKSVPLNMNEPCACSPPNPGPHWRGLVIRAPKQVTFKEGRFVGEFGAFAAIPLCGYHLLDIPPQPVYENMKITAINKANKVSYAGDIVTLDSSPEEPPPEIEGDDDDGDVTGMAAGGWFNPNMADYVRIPHESATYDVFIEYRGFKSNTVTIQLIKDK